jgi:hypothetical protein
MKVWLLDWILIERTEVDVFRLLLALIVSSRLYAKNRMRWFHLPEISLESYIKI